MSCNSLTGAWYGKIFWNFWSKAIILLNLEKEELRCLLSILDFNINPNVYKMEQG